MPRRRMSVLERIEWGRHFDVDAGALAEVLAEEPTHVVGEASLFWKSCTLFDR
jgi:hypothetical protein